MRAITIKNQTNWMAALACASIVTAGLLWPISDAQTADNLPIGRSAKAIVDGQYPAVFFNFLFNFDKYSQ